MEGLALGFRCRLSEARREIFFLGEELLKRIGQTIGKSKNSLSVPS